MCHRQIHPRAGEHPSDYRRRRYCGRVCAGRAVSRRYREAARLAALDSDRGRVEPEGYPGATYATDADVPPACPRCGGPWRQVEGGWSCYLCGRDCYVASALRVAIQRTLAEEDGAA